MTFLFKTYINAHSHSNCTCKMDGHIQIPFSMGIFGCRNSGKSVFTKNLLLSDLIDRQLKKNMDLQDLAR